MCCKQKIVHSVSVKVKIQAIQQLTWRGRFCTIFSSIFFFNIHWGTLSLVRIKDDDVSVSPVVMLLSKVFFHNLQVIKFRHFCLAKENQSERVSVRYIFRCSYACKTLSRLSCRFLNRFVVFQTKGLVRICEIWNLWLLKVINFSKYSRPTLNYHGPENGYGNWIKEHKDLSSLSIHKLSQNVLK